MASQPEYESSLSERSRQAALERHKRQAVKYRLFLGRALLTDTLAVDPDPVDMACKEALATKKAFVIVGSFIFSCQRLKRISSKRRV
jgi:hypothetical protein